MLKMFCDSQQSFKSKCHEVDYIPEEHFKKAYSFSKCNISINSLQVTIPGGKTETKANF